VAEQPDSAVAWHAAGCYYLCARQPEAARRHFARATQLDRGFSPAWVALAHACSAQGEADQAVAAYRAAHRLFPGLHAPLLGMAAEYARMGSLALAERLLAQASRTCPGDPLPAHERGVLALRAGEWATAEGWLRRALDLAAERGRGASGGSGGSGGKASSSSSWRSWSSSSSSLPFLSTSAAVAWEPALVNLGHAVRKQARYGEAASLYESALALAPRQAGTLAALGFARQLGGDSRGAADAYHQCLALRPDDAFALEMLSEALAEEYERYVADECRQEREERQGRGARAPPRYDAFLRPPPQARPQYQQQQQQQRQQSYHHDVVEDEDMMVA
jgi:anaphase-promoting complex subunit 6